MPRLTVVCGCPGTALQGASAAACSAGKGVRLFDMDAHVQTWIQEARSKRASFADWNVRSDKFDAWLRSGPRDFKSLERHARPVTDAITEYVAKMAIDALKTGDVVLVGHMSRDDRHSIVTLFEQHSKPAVDKETAEKLAFAADVAGKVADAAEDTASRVDAAVAVISGQYRSTVNVSDLSLNIASAALACDAAMELLDFSEGAFQNIDDAQLYLDRANRLSNPTYPSNTGPGQEVPIAKIKRFVDDLAQVLKAAQITAHQFTAASKRSKEQLRDAGARAYGKDLVALLLAARQLADAAAEVHPRDVEAAYLKLRHLKDDVMRGGASEDDEDDEDIMDYLSKEYKYDHVDKKPVAVPPQKVPEPAKVPELPQLMFVEILSTSQCPDDYETLDTSNGIRKSTVELIEGRHKYAIGQPSGPWVHNLEDDAKAAFYGSAASGEKCVDASKNKTDVWTHVKGVLARSGSGSNGYSGYDRSNGYAGYSSGYSGYSSYNGYRRWG